MFCVVGFVVVCIYFICCCLMRLLSGKLRSNEFKSFLRLELVLYSLCPQIIIYNTVQM